MTLHDRVNSAFNHLNAAQALQLADDEWQRQLEAAFPDAHEARYLPRGKGKKGTPLRRAYEAREAARIAWERALCGAASRVPARGETHGPQPH